MMQKFTTIGWVGEKIRKNTKSMQKGYQRMYFRYESIRDVESKIKEKGIVSGLTITKDETEMFEDHEMIVYGKR